MHILTSICGVAGIGWTGLGKKRVHLTYYDCCSHSELFTSWNLILNFTSQETLFLIYHCPIHYLTVLIYLPISDHRLHTYLWFTTFKVSIFEKISLPDKSQVFWLRHHNRIIWWNFKQYWCLDPTPDQLNQNLWGYCPWFGIFRNLPQLVLN